MDCQNINIKQASKGNAVKELQKYLQYLGYYVGEIDGDAGTYTVSAIKKYQTQNKLKVDGIWGPISCKSSNINGQDISLTYRQLSLKTWKNIQERFQNYKKDNGKEPACVYINKATTTATTSTSTNRTIFTSTPHCEQQGGGCLGQINGHSCGPHTTKQDIYKFLIRSITETTICSYAGTTSNGTSHQGIQTAISRINKLFGTNIKLEWVSFNKLGSTTRERFKKIGEIISDPKKQIITHVLYRDKYGHYEAIKTINLNTSNCIILNSLGNKCGGSNYCGYLETRSFSVEERYLNGISQPSIGILTLA